jgi:O-antigen/teichoic acid export membrane protein
MSTAVRLISGSVASWAQISVTMASQIILVPIYLSYWSVKTYGIWLALQGIMSALSMLDLGHQNYMGFEFLRFGRNDMLTLCKSFWSAMIVGILISLLQIVLMALFFFTGILTWLLGESGTTDVELINEAGVALVLLGVSWLIVMTIPGIIVRVLSPFGHYPRMAWWGFMYAIISAAAPLIAVVMGGSLLMASVAFTIGSLFYTVFLCADLLKLLKKEKIKFIKPSLSLGFSNFIKSLPILGKSVFENVRQQGVRLVLAPMAGPVGLAAFSTMRTGANVALQGLNTIINPLLPDLMRFLHERDQARSEAAFATVWIVVVAFMAPGVVILQTFIEPFYVFWTQGKISFDPLLFAVLSIGVLVYAVVQPAMAVVIGNNLTKTQLALATISAVIVFAVLILSVPVIGILGAAVALLIAEVVAAIGYKIYAQQWLIKNELLWPERAFFLATVSVLIATVSLVLMIVIPEYKWLILAISLLVSMWNLWRYWQVLPTVAVESAKNIIVRIPGVRKFFFCLISDLAWVTIKK